MGVGGKACGHDGLLAFVGVKKTRGKETGYNACRDGSND